MRVDSFESCVKYQVLFYCQIVPEDIKLWTKSDLQLNGFKLVLDVKASNPGVSSGRREQSCKHGYKSRLSCTIWTKKSKHFPLFNSEREVLGCYLQFPAPKSWILFSQLFYHEWVFIIVCLIKIVDNVSFSLSICVLETHVIVKKSLLVVFSVLLKVTNLIIVVCKTLSDLSNLSLVSSAQEIPLFGHSV